MSVIVYYADRIYRESSNWIQTHELPDGAYIRWNIPQGIVWYWVRHNRGIPISLSDIPKSIKALCLLTGKSL